MNSQEIIKLNFNQTNLVSNGLNNFMQFQAPNGSYDLRNYVMCLKSINIPYSFPSFKTASYFQYRWIDGTLYPVAIPANTTWEIADLNGLMESVMITNGHYLINGSGNYVFYAQMVANANYYTTTLQFTPFPTALPVGWQNPASISFPVAQTYLQLLFTPQDIQTILGFTNAGPYPASQTPATTLYAVNSQVAPQVSPYSSIQIWCDCLSSVDNNTPKLLDTFPIDVSYGQAIIYEPKFPSWVYCNNSATYAQINVYLLDQYGNPLTVLDPSWSIQILLKKIGSSGA